MPGQVVDPSAPTGAPVEVPGGQAAPPPNTGPVPEGPQEPQQAPVAPTMFSTVAEHAQALQNVKSSLVSLGAMLQWEADHLFTPIFTHLAGR